jgi:hypothetical protein
MGRMVPMRWAAPTKLISVVLRTGPATLLVTLGLALLAVWLRRSLYRRPRAATTLAPSRAAATGRGTWTRDE